MSRSKPEEGEKIRRGCLLDKYLFPYPLSRIIIGPPYGAREGG